jgi:hypothetical protein
MKSRKLDLAGHRSRLKALPPAGNSALGWLVALLCVSAALGLLALMR